MDPAIDSPVASNSTASIKAGDSIVDSLSADGEFAACVARLERHWPKPKLATLTPVMQRLGRFEIRRELGRGRFGVVFLAWDPQLQRQVALKVPQFDAAIDPELRERFRGEALAAGKLQHPGIVSLYDVGQHAGVDYLAMAYIEGTTLAERLKLGPLPAADAARMMVSLATAVHHAHDQGVIHRDLKPSNVLLDKDDQPHVMDFGLARRLSDSAMRATATGQVIGTPAYMPPEQATGQTDTSASSDVYSLGVILYETLTGHPPFQAATFVEAVEFILNRDPLPPSKLNPKLPRELDAITLKCLEKNPASRYASAADLADDLQRHLDGRPIRAKTHSYPQQALRWCLKHPSRALLLIATGIAFALLVTTASIYTRWQHADELAVQQKRIADTQRYFASVHRLRNVIASRPPGWTSGGLGEIESVVASGIQGSDPVDLRSLAAQCLAGFDVKEEAIVASGMWIGRIALSANGQQLAVGELKGTATCRVIVYDTNSKEVQHSFTISNVETNFFRMGKGEAKWQDGVREFAFSPDGRFLAAGMRFGLVYVFDLSNPKEPPRKLTVSRERELAKIRFSTDGQTLFALTKDDEFLRWKDWQKSTEVDVPWKASQVSFAVARSADRMFLQSSQGGELRVCDQSLQFCERFSPGAPLTKGLEKDLTTDSLGRIVAGESPHGLRAYDAETGHLLRRLQDDSIADGGFVDELSMTADGQLLAAFDDAGIVRFFDLAAGRQAMTLQLGRYEFQDVALDPERQRLVVSNDGKLHFWRIKPNSVHRVLNHLVDQVIDARFSPDGNQLACVVSTGSIHAHMRSSLLTFDAASGQQTQRIDHGFDRIYLQSDVGQVAWHPSGQELAWSGPFGVLRFARNAQNQLQYQGPVPAASEVLPVEIGSASDPDSVSGRTWKLSKREEPIELKLALPKDIETDKRIPVLLISLHVAAPDSAAPPFSCDLEYANQSLKACLPPPWVISRDERGFQQWAWQLPSDKSVWKEAKLRIKPASHLTDLQIERIDLAILNITGQGSVFPNVGIPDQLSFAASSERLWGYLTDDVASWSWPGGVQKATWRNPQHALSGAGQIRALQAGKSGTAVGTRDGLVYWLSPDRGNTVGIWSGGGKEVTSLALCEAANLVLAGVDNGNVRALSLPQGKQLFDLHAADDAIVALAATPDGSWLTTASGDRHLKLWRRSQTSYDLYCQLPDTSAVVRSLQLSSCGRRLAVVTRSTALVELWDLEAFRTELKRLRIE